MQIFYNTQRDTFTNVIEPVSQQILTTVLKELGYLDFFESNIYYISNLTGGSITDDENNNVKLTDNRVTCEIMDNLNPRQRETLTPGDMTNYGMPYYRLAEKSPILYDNVHKIYMSNHLVPAKIDLQTTVTFLSYSEASNFMSRLYSVYGNSASSSVQTISFDTPVSEDMTLVLLSLYKLFATDINDFYKYLSDKSDASICFNSDQADGRRELIIKNGQTDVVVKIEFDQEKPESQRENSVSKSYNIVIKLSAIITHTHALFLHYSEVINNQLIPRELHPQQSIMNSKYLNPQDPVLSYQEYLARYEWLKGTNWNNTLAYSKKYLNNVGSHPFTERLMIQEPWFDKWNIPATSYLYKDKKFKPFFCAIFTLDEPGPTTLDLAGNINGITLTQFSIDAMMEDQEKCLNARSLPKMLINIYADDAAVHEDNISINGTEITLLNSNINSAYRVVLSKNMTIVYPGVFLTVWNADINVYREGYRDGSDLRTFFK